MSGNDDLLIDKGSYQHIWEQIIDPVIKDYQNRFAEVDVAHNAQDVIWQEYVRLNCHCKEYYMRDVGGRLDRHKVCACYMYAIIKASVLSCRLAEGNTEQRYLALNENLAITVGLSLLRAFVISSIDNSKELSKEEKDFYQSRIDGGIVFPQCNHGVYRENFASELHYTNEERNYNVLSLANTLFLLETHTLQIEAVSKQGKTVAKGQKKK